MTGIPMEVDLDLTYALGELQNLQTEMEQYFGKNGTILARLEGIEARLGEITSALRKFAEETPYSPWHAASELLLGLTTGETKLVLREALSKLDTETAT